MALANKAATPVVSSVERDELIQQYAPLVKYVVGRLAIGLPAILDYEDILSYGTIGLIEALDRFDASKGVKFETYAINRIRGSIIDALRMLDRLPRSVRQKAKKLDAVTTELLASLGRDPSEDEIAEAAGMTPVQYQKALVNSSWVTVSLDGMLERDENNDASPTEMPANPNDEDFTRRLEKRQLLESLTDSVKGLPERELLIVSLYYRDQMTMKEIAKILEISESRVCQLHGRAVGRLRQRLTRDLAA